MMNKILKSYLKKYLFSLGYRISKINNNLLQDANPFLACKSVIKIEKPIIFDIGMNHGQTLNKIKFVFPSSVIHGFEPSKYCFKQLQADFMTLV